tara:strand:- start:215 stop:1342 length:1128 start_codon:yes stop_codon:yes gene_type:complete
MIKIIKPLVKQFLPFAQKRMGFTRPPKLFLRSDTNNAQNPLGKTAFYDPNNESITLYIDGRHPKDVMRSFSHELVHHAQNCRGDFNNASEMGEGYAQNDEHLREMEREAYEVGNMCFRDWEDGIKSTIYYEHLQKGENKMSTKDWKNKELTTLLSEAWGFKFNSLQEFEEFDGTGEVQEENGDAFAPNHYCVHHGGVEHNGAVQMAEAVSHNWNDELGQVTHYDMKLKDGTILENVAVEDIQITDASLAEGHGGHPAKRDHDDDDKEMDEGEDHDDKKMDESPSHPAADREGNRATGRRVKQDDGQRLAEEEDELEEAAKPDYIDLDKDGDKEESMKKAAADAKEKKGDDKKNESVDKDSLQEAIAALLRKHLRG